MTDRWQHKSASKPQPKHRRKLKDVYLDDPNDKAFHLVSAWAACFFLNRSRSRFFSAFSFHCECHTNFPPHLKLYCLLVSIHLRPRYMVFRVTLIYSIPARRFQNEPWGAVSIGSSSVNNLRMVSKLVEEMLCRLPIILFPLPLQPHLATLSRYRIHQKHRQDMLCPTPIYQKQHPVIQPPKILQSQKHEIRQFKNSHIWWARGKPHMWLPSARKEQH